MGRHTIAEMEQLAARDIDAIADFLADKPYLMGEAPSGADATVFPFVAHALCPLFETAILTCAERRANLVAYRDRMMAAVLSRTSPGWTARPHERPWQRDSSGASAGGPPSLSMDDPAPRPRRTTRAVDHPVARTFAAPFGVG